MNKTDKEYLRVLKDIKENGRMKSDRTGTGTLSTFGKQIRFDFSEGFPILTTKNVWFSGIKTELLWFLGNHLSNIRYLKFDRTNIRYLLDNNNHIWSEWPFKKYLKDTNQPDIKVNSEDWNILLKEWEHNIQTDDDFCYKWGNLGPVYGKQWMDWNSPIMETDGSGEYFIDGVTHINQIQNVIDKLKTNPDDRRMIVNSWNVGDIDDMALPPCHLLFQFYSEELTIQERVIYAYHLHHELPEDGEYHEEVLNELNIPKRRLSIQWYQRSCDYFLGIPFNITSYALLLDIISREVNMMPHEVIGSLGDTHLYLNHLDQADEQLSRKVEFRLPQLDITEGKSIFELLPEDIKLKGYKKGESIKAPIAV